MTHIFLPVRSVCEIISRPVYFQDTQYNETIQDVYRKCFSSYVHPGTKIIDPVCLQLLDAHKKYLFEKFAEGASSDEIVTGLDEADTPELRYDFVTAVNKLRGFYSENPILKRLGLNPSGELITKEFEEGFTMRGRLDSTTKKGYPVEVKTRAKQIYVTVPRNEYIQCMLYCALTDQQSCLLVQEFRGLYRWTQIRRNECEISEIIDNVVALTESLRAINEAGVDAEMSRMPEFNWSIPRFVKKCWETV